MRTAIVFVLGFLALSPALAHPEDSDKRTPTDPNKVVCKSEDVLGSRLQTQKQCMTVAQWEQQRHDQANMIGQAQAHSGR